MATIELKLPDVAEEDKQAIADIEAELKALYDEEEETGVPALRAKKIELNEKHRAAVVAGFENRQTAIDADPELKALQTKLNQGAEVYGGNL